MRSLLLAIGVVVFSQASTDRSPESDGNHSRSGSRVREAGRGCGGGRRWYDPSHRRLRNDDRHDISGHGRSHRRESGLRSRDRVRAGCCRRRAGGCRGVAATTDRRGNGHRRGVNAHRQTSRRSADARRGAGARRDRREDAHDTGRHRHDAERNGRHARAGDLPVAWCGQRADSRHARPVHQGPVGRPAALR